MSQELKKILFAEDDPLLIDIYTIKLREAGFKVEVAKDGKEVLRKLETEEPDLLILDVVLPDIDGWEILKIVKNKLKLTTLKIIIFSNLGQRDEVEKGLKLGAIRYLIKSHYTPNQIVEEIKKIFNEQSH